MGDDWLGFDDTPEVADAPETALWDDDDKGASGDDEADETDDANSSDADTSAEQFILPGEYRYMPVLGFNEIQVASKIAKEEDVDEMRLDLNGEKWDASWWEKKRNQLHEHHPYVLVNPVEAYQYTRGTDMTFREVCRFQKGEQLVISDSGGFQMTSRPEANVVYDREDHSFPDDQLHPVDVLEWQVENADSGTILDMPPYAGFEGSPDDFGVDAEYDDWRTGLFEERLSRSKKNAELMHEHLETLRSEGNQRAQDYIQLGVIQGTAAEGANNQYESLKRWYDEISSVKDYDGWALSPKPSHNLSQVALHLAFAEEYLDDARWLHVLQVGSLCNKALLMYYAWKSDNEHFITSDSSTPSSGGRFRQFYMPPGFGDNIHVPSYDEDSTEDEKYGRSDILLERWPARGHVISKIQEAGIGVEWITQGTGTLRNAVINLHNLEVILQGEQMVTAIMRGMREDPVNGLEVRNGRVKSADTRFWKLMRQATSDHKVVELYRAMEFVKIAIEDGIDVADEHIVPWPGSDQRGNAVIQKSGSAMSW